MISRKNLFIVALILMAVVPVAAENIKGSSSLLCATMQVHECDRVEEGGCQSRAPAALNIPLFVEIDIDEKLIHTTEISDAKRSTEIRHVDRGDGVLTLQGSQLDRAFAIIIDEESGLSTMSVTGNGEIVVIYGACTTR